MNHDDLKMLRSESRADEDQDENSRDELQPEVRVGNYRIVANGQCLAFCKMISLPISRHNSPPGSIEIDIGREDSNDSASSCYALAVLLVHRRTPLSRAKIGKMEYHGNVPTMPSVGPW